MRQQHTKEEVLERLYRVARLGLHKVDPMTAAVVNQLAQGTDIFDVLDMLLVENARITKLHYEQVTELINYTPVQYAITVSKERFDELKQTIK